jgi:hypothetical protein
MREEEECNGRQPMTRSIRVARKKLSLTFTKLELVQDRCFTGSIETDHQDSHLFLAELSLSLIVEQHNEGERRRDFQKR